MRFAFGIAAFGIGISMFRLYFDAHATTPCDPQVVDAMLPYFTERFGNAASLQHAYGWEAQQAVETARQQVADLVGARLRDVIFTSGATESNNLALLGVIQAAGGSHAGSSRTGPETRDPRPDRHVVTLVDRAPGRAGPLRLARDAGGARHTRGCAN